MPLKMATSVPTKKKPVIAREIHNRVKDGGWEYKDVLKAVTARSWQQKYAVEHCRALAFLQLFQNNRDLQTRMPQCYARNGWDEGDMKKVCIPK